MQLQTYPFSEKGGGPVDNHKNKPNRLINEKSPYLLRKINLFSYLLGIADGLQEKYVSLVPCDGTGVL